MNENNEINVTEEVSESVGQIPEEELPTEEAALTAEEEGAGTELEELSALAAEIPALAGTPELSEAVNGERYRELRALGLTPREAYLATRNPRPADTRAHLTDSYPRTSVSPVGQISHGELSRAREIFEGLSDKEIIRLYKKVTAR